MHFLTTAFTLLALAASPIFAAPVANYGSESSEAELEARSQTPMMMNRNGVLDGTNIEFESCDSSNTVAKIEISPCNGNGTMEDPCVFSAGSNYTIIITYLPPAGSKTPRSGLAAEDPTSLQGYAYSGQSFDACEYTVCPIVQNATSTYTYNFVTLNSPFDKLTYNVTDGLFGESLMCASFPITFDPPATTSERSYLPRLPFGGMRGRKMMGV